jgi:hypothetical protein
MSANETYSNRRNWENSTRPIFPIQDIVDKLYASRKNMSKTNTSNVEINDCKNKYYVITKLRKNHWYIILYVFGSEVIFVEILPWITVIILNLLTWRSIKTFQQNRARFAGRQSLGKIPKFKTISPY